MDAFIAEKKSQPESTSTNQKKESPSTLVPHNGEITMSEHDSPPVCCTTTKKKRDTGLIKRGTICTLDPNLIHFCFERKLARSGEARSLIYNFVSSLIDMWQPGPPLDTPTVHKRQLQKSGLIPI